MYEFPYVLTINAGSSSVKAELFALPTRKLLHAFTLEDIGLPVTRNTITSPHNTETHMLAQMEPREALAACVSFIRTQYVQQPLLVAHRLVHGGNFFTEPTRLSSDVVAKLRTLVPLAPNHLPTQLSYVEDLLRAYPSATHVGCFDTAFHADMLVFFDVRRVEHRVAGRTLEPQALRHAALGGRIALDGRNDFFDPGHGV